MHQRVGHSLWGRGAAVARGAGFTLIELLIAVAVVAVLIAIMLPSIGRVQEQARRVMCSSNQRQVGIGVSMFADGSQGSIPATLFVPGDSASKSTAVSAPQDTIMLRLPGQSPDRAGKAPDWWDGLGLLFSEGYLNAPRVFYCPSHTGEHPFERYEDEWGGERGQIAGNFQYRGEGPGGSRKLYVIDSSAALVADGVRSLSDLNHGDGFNVLRAGLHVEWLKDEGGVVASILAMAPDGGSEGTTDSAWRALDDASASQSGGSSRATGG